MHVSTPVPMEGAEDQRQLFQTFHRCPNARNPEPRKQRTPRFGPSIKIRDRPSIDRNCASPQVRRRLPPSALPLPFPSPQRRQIESRALLHCSPTRKLQPRYPRHDYRSKRPHRRSQARKHPRTMAITPSPTARDSLYHGSHAGPGSQASRHD